MCHLEEIYMTLLDILLLLYKMILCLIEVKTEVRYLL